MKQVPKAQISVFFHDLRSFRYDTAKMRSSVSPVSPRKTQEFLVMSFQCHAPLQNLMQSLLAADVGAICVVKFPCVKRYVSWAFINLETMNQVVMVVVQVLSVSGPYVDQRSRALLSLLSAFY